MDEGKKESVKMISAAHQQSPITAECGRTALSASCPLPPSQSSLNTPTMSQSPIRSGTPNASGSGASTPAAGHKHALTAVEKQRSQLERLLKDPAKPVYIPPPPKEKAIRAPREMMKNVQGSSAGAGSGEFHVYKAARRREYERLRLLEEEAEKVSGLARSIILARSCRELCGFLDVAGF